jgi:TonB family protein
MTKPCRWNNARLSYARKRSVPRFQGGILNGTAVKLVQPIYPALARRDHASGQVQVRVLIDEAGKVIQAKAINPGSLHMSLVAAAEDAARQSVFTPKLSLGVPVKVYGVVICNFLAQ